ncbi:MAG: hypothetical protein KAS23_03680 [Anaerohalosphaera sp.]|nr:hypothetical protein [Anaerohalosphaera sp.]
MFTERCSSLEYEAMRLLKWLVMGLLLSCWLLFAACQGRQTQSVGVPPPAAKPGQDSAPKNEAQTEDYINAWTSTDADPDPNSSYSTPSKEGRERMLADDTDRYIRSFTLPTESEEMSKKPVSGSNPSQDKPVVPPTSNTDDFVNGWTFE